MRHSSTACPPAPGITLIELLVALAIVAILAALAFPSFQESIRKSRRADAMAGLAEIQQAQERYRANNPSYQAVLANLPGARSVSADQHYDLSIPAGSVSATGYSARATVRGGSPQATDLKCNVMQVRMLNGNITYTSTTSGGDANGSPDPCWAR
jgi:type IV pilus assembly protein PilE